MAAGSHFAFKAIIKFWTTKGWNVRILHNVEFISVVIFLHVSKPIWRLAAILDFRLLSVVNQKT